MSYALKKAAASLGKMARENPAIAGEVLAEISRKHGSVTPARVVEESRAIDAPLHDFFEWDDSVAGGRWREHQASYLIRAVVTTLPGVPEPVRGFVHVESEADEETAAGEYRPIAEVLDDETMRGHMLHRALSICVRGNGSTRRCRSWTG
jgi:hypothetical protein